MEQPGRGAAESTPEMGDVAWAQKDGGPPKILAAGSAPGESGVSILKVLSQGGAHLSATPQRHLVWFTSAARIACRMGGRTLRHEAPWGSLAICHAGVDCDADTEESIGSIVVAIDPRHFALAAAENSSLEAQLIERLSGSDRALLDLARTLALESANGYPNGALFWNGVANGFIDGLLARHTSELQHRRRGMLDKDVLRQLKDYVIAHVDESIDVEALAKIAGQSPFHFSRVFARAVGMTPHRYVVHLRLQRAIELVRDGRSGLAEIAVRTGFADQSHLSRWVRRVHGVSLTQLSA
jgi:AraC family transcriptional regulator